MLCEHSTLANVPRLLADTLREDYDVDPAPLLKKVRIDEAKFLRPGARVAYSKMQDFWSLAVKTTGDPSFGFRVGERSVPEDFYVLGHSWLASGTLFDVVERLCRYIAVVSTVQTGMRVERSDDTVALIETFPDRSLFPHRAAYDAGQVALINLLSSIARRDVHPLSAEIMVDRGDTGAQYEALYQCPIAFGAEYDKILFSFDDMDEPLLGSVPEILDASDEIAEKYLEALNEVSVAADVRRQVVQLLPSGRADQATVAEKLFRSRATLQRQLSAEGTSYRDILNSTRHSLAERYLRSGQHNQAEIAFLTGFADQSNFARAFKRWSGVTPGEYQKEMAEP
jgi:AraC-like DNA-binding protein